MIFALDPSLSCTGFALLSRDGATLIDHGRIGPDCDGDAYSRAASIASLAVLEIRKVKDKLAAVVIEAPQTFTRGMRGKRSAARLPNYGIAVGVITYAVDMELKGAGVTLLRPSASEWTRGMPGTRGDDDKVRRVQAVERRFGLEIGSLGAKSVAGNVADAALLGCWAAERLMMEGARK